MRFSAAIFVIFLALRCSPAVSGQALQVDLEEFKRLAGEVADLRDANTAQQKRISSLQRELEQLREAVRTMQDRTTTKLGDFATREDLKKTVDQTIKEVDARREADKRLILGEFDNLAKALAQAKPSRRDPEPRNTEPAKPYVGDVLEYTVKGGDALSSILSRFNTQLQAEGRPTISQSDVVQANPGLNPNRIFAGQVINLPVPKK